MTGKTRPRIDVDTTCACGAVAIAAHGDVWSMFLCACVDCQKTSGTGHNCIAILDPAAVEITGELSAYSRLADSGSTVVQYFCPVCGNPIYATTSRRQDAMFFAAGTLGGGDWYKPRRLIFARSHHDWDKLPDIPQYDTYPER